jgi:hypothetical protein
VVHHFSRGNESGKNVTDLGCRRRKLKAGRPMAAYRVAGTPGAADSSWLEAVLRAWVLPIDPFVIVMI